MKKIFALVLAAMLLCTMIPAVADVFVSGNSDLNWYSLDLNRYSGTLYGRETREGSYYVVDLHGNKLTQAYDDISTESAGFRVELANGSINCRGLVDGMGHQIMPCIYGEVDMLSDRWAIGKVLVPSTEDNYDYKTYSTPAAFFLVSAVDVYYMGTKVGSVSRVDYDYASARGAFLSIKSKAGAYAYYDSSFRKSTYTTEYSSEYDYNWNTKEVWHVASNQRAFVPGCSLNAKDVEKPWYEISKNVLDLQGNLLFVNNYSYIGSSVTDTLYQAKDNNMYGVIDIRDGHVVVPFEYDSISYTYYGGDYIGAVKAGKFCYVSLVTGQVAYQTNYPDSVVTNYGGVGRVKDLSGEYIIVTPYGELAQHFSDVSLVYGAASVFEGTINDVKSIYDLHGNQLLTGDKYYYVANNGKVVLGSNSWGKTYHAFTLEEVVATAPEAAPAGNETVDAGWICPNCSTVNSGKFCTECGTSKPAETWICQECGAENSGKFCAECGAAKVENWTCPGCGATNSGKFCADCGTPKP